MHLLLVDDNQATALPLAAHLRQQGYVVSYVADGLAAVAACRENPPDLVLMDVVMPKMDGIAATRLIKAHAGERWLPLILMTSLSAKDEILAGFAAGADDYLVKPLDLDFLNARMRSMQRVVCMQHRLLSVVDHVNDAVLTIDEAGIVQSYNKAAERIFRYRADEVIGANVKILMPAAYAADHDAYIARYLRDREPHVIGSGRKFSGRRKNGEIFSMDISVTEMRTLGGYQFIGVVRDVSADEIARKKAESAARLIAQRGRFIRTITDAIPSLISYWDKDLYCSFANAAYLEWFGQAPDAIIGITLQELLGDDLFALNAPYLQGVMAGERQVFEQTMTKADGVVGHTLTYYIPDRDSENAVAGFFVLVTDVTALKAVERLKDEFVSLVSHELRTPLTSIRGALGLVLGRCAQDLPDNVRQLLENANRNSERLSLLINDILDMEKLAAGKLSFQMAIQPLMPLVEESLTANYGYAVAHHVQFVLVERAEDVMVNVDSQRLAQVLSNYLSNAAKFSPDQSRVEIRVQRRGAQVRVAVHDFGPGVPADFQAHIFSKFSQADTSNTKKLGGTGLGLAITLEMVKRMGGKVGFDSVAGDGATFWFDLPICTSTS